jgi:hypothetical protein
MPQSRVLSGLMIVLIATVAGLTSSTAQLKEDAPISAKTLASSPASYYGKDVIMEELRCIAVGNRYSCIKEAGGRMLRIDGDEITSYTAPKVAKYMAEECTGSANLMREECLLNAIFTPRRSSQVMFDTGNGTMPMVVINTDMLEIYFPEKKKRR